MPGNQGQAQLSAEAEHVTVFRLLPGIPRGQSIPSDFIFAVMPESLSEPEGGGLWQ